MNGSTWRDRPHGVKLAHKRRREYLARVSVNCARNLEGDYASNLHGSLRIVTSLIICNLHVNECLFHRHQSKINIRFCAAKKIWSQERSECANLRAGSCRGDAISQEAFSAHRSLSPV
eukprot:scaffold185550_cov33-Tisochrysis_lutea.AAC.3